MINQEAFDQFWQTYPRKVGKAKCKRKWETMSPDKETFISIMSGLEKAIRYWKTIDPKFIPHPYTWLNREGWEDEYKCSLKQESHYANQSTSYKRDNTPISENRAERLRAIRQRVGI